jgi:hypothetical protein
MLMSDPTDLVQLARIARDAADEKLAEVVLTPACAWRSNALEVRHCHARDRGAQARNEVLGEEMELSGNAS